MTFPISFGQPCVIKREQRRQQLHTRVNRVIVVVFDRIIGNISLLSKPYDPSILIVAFQNDKDLFILQVSMLLLWIIVYNKVNYGLV